MRIYGTDAYVRMCVCINYHFAVTSCWNGLTFRQFLEISQSTTLKHN